MRRLFIALVLTACPASEGLNAAQPACAAFPASSDRTDWGAVLDAGCVPSGTLSAALAPASSIADIAGVPVDSAAGTLARVPFNGAFFPHVAFPDQTSVSALLVSAVQNSKQSLRLAVYDFTLQDVWEAIQNAHKSRPSLRIQVVLDESHVFPAGGKPRNPQLDALLNASGIEVRVIRGSGPYGIMHDKFGIYDAFLLGAQAGGQRRLLPGGEEARPVERGRDREQSEYPRREPGGRAGRARGPCPGEEEERSGQDRG